MSSAGSIRLRLSIALSVAIIFPLAGCSEEGEVSLDVMTPTEVIATTSPESPTKVSAGELVSQMVIAYRKATSYSDTGRCRLQFKQGDTNVDETFDFAVVYASPKRLRLHCYSGIYLCDGEHVFANIGQLPGQVLKTDAPDELTLENIFSDMTLSSALGAGGAGIVGIAPQLTLLLTDEFKASIMQDAGEPTLLDDAKIGAHVCHRVRIPRADGSLFLWIDSKSLVLRRIEYPTDVMREQLEQQGPVSNLRLTADFTDARINEPIAEVAFEYQVPADAKVVTTFDTRELIPEPQPPSELLGKTMGAFEFQTLDGQRIDHETLSGKVVVFDFWATWCAPCIDGLPRLEQVYQRYKDNPNISFFAVSTDTSDVSDDQLREKFSELGLTIPILRDPQIAARDVFQVAGIPNMFVLGPDGTVQHNEIGANPNLAAVLPEYLDRLLRGENVAELSLAKYQKQLADYERMMSEPAPTQVAPANPTTRSIEIAAHTEPEHLTLRKAWSCETINRPGNIVATITDAGQLRILVLDAARAIVELNSQGEIVATHPMEISTEAAVTYLRTAVDGQNKRYFVGSAPAQQQVHVFDESLKLVLSYPPEGQHAGISDVAIADLDGNGELELVIGYWGVVGVQAVTLRGERLWANKSLEDVLSFALTGADSGGQQLLLCANRRGTLVPIDSLGNSGNEITVDGRFPVLIRSGDLNGDSQIEFCTISPTLSGGQVVVGLHADASEAWNYELPAGAHQQPIESLTSGILTSDGERAWVVAAADGSLHFLAADGTLIDHFRYGAELTGVALIDVGDERLLLVATRTDKGGVVEAWSVDEDASP